MSLKKKLLIAVSIVLVGILLGVIYANRYVKKLGYDGLTDLANTYYHNKSLADKVEAKQLNITLSKSDFDFIKAKRAVAIDRGVQINVGDNYVDCEVDFDNEKSNGVIRLKGHMTDHLQGDKWSYRVKTDVPVLGMYRFSIQHPGTRNYVYEWIYHQLLKNEDIIYLNYDFINVNINGNDLGIYALEEHFGQHVLTRNNRPKGAILRWNPELYWDWRIDELQGEYIDEQYSHYSSSYAEPYDKGTVKRDPDLVENYQKGAYQLEMFRRGELKASEVFDVERMAKFHVIIDLVGGHHSLDWSDVKFYYNSETGKVEPVGYESFSIRKTERIAGQRIPLNYEKVSFNYHDELFSDPVFFESYIRNMERIVSEAYIQKFMADIQPELDKKMGIIAKEWPYRKVSFKGYYENVKLIRNNIDLPKPFHAFIVPDTTDQLCISLAPVSDFPVQIIGVKRKNKSKKLEEEIHIPAKARGTYTEYIQLKFKNPFKKTTNLYLVAKIPGSSKTFEVIVNEFPAYLKANDMSDSIISGHPPIDTNIIAAKDKHWTFKALHTTLNKEVFVPKDVTLYLYPNQSLTIEDKGKLRVEGQLVFQGYDEEEPVKIINKNPGSLMLNHGSFSLRHAELTGAPLIVSNGSNVIINRTIMHDMTALISSAYQSKLVINESVGGHLKGVGEVNESIVYIHKSKFSDGEVFLEFNGSYANIIDTDITHFQKAFDLSYGSTVKTGSGNFNSFDTIATLRHGSSIVSVSTKLSDSNFGFWWDTESITQTKDLIKLYNNKINKVSQLMVI